MAKLLDIHTVLLLFALVRCGDIAISSARAGDTLRAIIYGLVALFALVATFLLLFMH